jgi:hypothetical protein
MLEARLDGPLSAALNSDYSHDAFTRRLETWMDRAGGTTNTKPV